MNKNMKYLWERKRYWLYPFIGVLVFVGLLIFFAGNSSTVAPILYILR